MGGTLLPMIALRLRRSPLQLVLLLATGISALTGLLLAQQVSSPPVFALTSTALLILLFVFFHPRRLLVAVLVLTTVTTTIFMQRNPTFDATALAAELVPEFDKQVTVPLLETTVTAGAPAALSALRLQRSGNGFTDHKLAHAIGVTSVRVLGDPKQAFSTCVGDFNFGCTHGVIDEYMLRARLPAGSDLATLCSTVFGALSSASHAGECSHGLGHAFMTRQARDLDSALALCARLGTATTQDACGAGVFMEGIGTAREALTWTTTAAPYQPCAALAPTWHASCYRTQVLAWAVLFSRDRVRMAGLCAALDAPSRSACFDGFGVWLRGRTPGPLAAVADACRSSTSVWWDSCLLGALGDSSLSPQEISTTCQQLREEFRGRCYANVGSRLDVQQAPAPVRMQTCLDVDVAYRWSCANAAGITVP